MILYAFTRDGGHATNHSTRESALLQFASHVKFRVEKEGAKQVSTYGFQPPDHEPGTMVRVGGSESKPEQRPADPIECCMLEVVLLERDGKRTVYRLSRKVVIE